RGPPPALFLSFFRPARPARVPPADPSLPPEYYLLPTDAIVDNLPARGWSLDKALDQFGRQGHFQVVCWLGTAIQAESATGGKNPPAIDAARLNRDWLSRVAPWS